MRVCGGGGGVGHKGRCRPRHSLMQALMKTGGASFVWNWQLVYTACIDANQCWFLRELYLQIHI